MKRLKLRINELGKIRPGNKQQSADQRDQINRFRQAFRRVFRLLRQRRHRIEAKEAETEQRNDGQQRRDADLGIVKRHGRKQRPFSFATLQAVDRQNEKEQKNKQLQQKHVRVELRCQLDAENVDRRNDGDKGHNPDEHRNRREKGRQRDADEQGTDHRAEHVVDNDRPADNKTDVRTKCLLGKRVGRPRIRERFDQLRVAVRGKQHDNHGDGVSRGHHSVRTMYGDTIRREKRLRSHKSKPEKDDVPKS